MLLKFDTQTETAQQADTGLPTWEALMADLFDACERKLGAHQALLALRDTPPSGFRGFLFSVGFRIARALPPDNDFRKLCEPNWQTLHRFVLEQVYRNATLRDSDEKSDAWVFGPHNQLPCSNATLEDRVALIKRHVALDQPLLIIGDDDMQSLRLAEEGFADITTIEIDPIISKRISDAAAQRSLPIQVICRSIDEIGVDLVRAYGAVLMDPPCNPEGLAVFFDSARCLNAGQPGSKLFLSTHFLSHGKEGYDELRRSLADSGYKQLMYEPAFNRYPIPHVSKFILNTMLRIVVPELAKSPARFFVSDLVVLECR
jgi:hypothetical protein